MVQVNSQLDFSKVHPLELTDGELLLLRECAELSYYGHEVKDIIKEVLEGWKQLWKITGPGVDWIALVEVHQMPQWKNLLVWGAAGKGCLRTFQGFKDHCARVNGCKTVSVISEGKAWQRLYSKLDKIKHYDLWIQEVGEC